MASTDLGRSSGRTLSRCSTASACTSHAPSSLRARISHRARSGAVIVTVVDTSVSGPSRSSCRKWTSVISTSSGAAPKTSQAAESARPQCAAPGKTALPCTRWSPSQGSASVPVPARQQCRTGSPGNSVWWPGSGAPGTSAASAGGAASAQWWRRSKVTVGASTRLPSP